MDNLKMRQTRDNVIAVLNNSGLCAEAKRLIVMEVYSLATKAAEEVIALEFNQQNQQIESEVTDDEHQLE